jgi:hypothetical protein
MTPEQIAALAIAFGGGSVITAVVNALIKAASGRVGRERDSVSYERRLRFESDDRADKEAAKRRILQEYASALRSMAVQHGVQETSLPPWPDDTTLPRARVKEIAND